MDALAENVYFENDYPGVTLGVVVQPRGLIQIDAPPAPDDGRAWRASLMNLGGGPERVLVGLDSHPDRTLGARAMECSVIAHEKTAQDFRSRPTTLKAPDEQSGADWETISGLGSIRWVSPEISFSHHLELHWGGTPILLEHHPGPTGGAIWVILLEQKIVFVGDAVLKNQPPFLANANLRDWIAALGVLLGPGYCDFTVVSGRGGPVAPAVIQAQLDALKEVQTKIEKLAAAGAPPEATEKLVEGLLSAFKAPAARQKQYAQRLRYGLYQYYVRHFRPNGTPREE